MGEVSVYDVAKVAGVHSSTVSRAFSRPEAVNQETRGRILRIADELGYRVNPVGQALRRGASNLVPLIVPDITNPFYSELAKATAAAAGERGYQLVLCVTENAPEQTGSYLRAMEAMMAPFAIVAPSIRLDQAILGQSTLASRMVVIDRVPADIEVPTVTLDNRLGVEIALDHMLGLGHRRIAYLTGMVGTYSGQDRLDAWRELAPEHGIEPIVLRGGYGAEKGEGAARAFLEIPDRPTAVIASNDMAALAFLSRVASRGIRVPEDLSLIGFDAVSIGETSNPPLTSVRQPIDELGRTAIELAQRFAENRAVEHVQLRPGLQERASTGRYISH